MNRFLTQLRSPRRSLESCLSVAEDWYFDNRFRLDTRSEVAIDDLDISPSEKQHADKYKPTRTRYFRKLMRLLPHDRDGVFVDVGCGKGRILLLASMYGFDTIRGIEISPNLSRIAKRNIDAFRSRRAANNSMEVLCSNVLDYQFRHDENLFFLYSPFDFYVTQSFLDRIRLSIKQVPRKLCIVINEFRFPELLDNDDVFQLSNTLRYGSAFFRIYRNH
jgi:SAM-dependent methyltransferase